MIAIILSLVSLIFAQTQQCIFYKPDGTRSIREAYAGGNCVKSNDSPESQNECCTSTPTGPTCSFQQRTKDALPEWYEDTSSKTGTSTTCFVAKEWNSCYYILKDGTSKFLYWTGSEVVDGGAGYKWRAGCDEQRPVEGDHWRASCLPESIGNNNVPKITQVPKDIHFLGQGLNVYRKTVYCHME